MNWSIRYAVEDKGYRWNPAPSIEQSVPLSSYDRLSDHIDYALSQLDREEKTRSLYNDMTNMFGRTLHKDVVRSGLERLRTLSSNPDSKIEIYRAVPTHISDINSGDWITTMKEYAERHSSMEDENYHILSRIVPIKNVRIRKPDPRYPTLFKPQDLAALSYHE